MWCVGDCFEVRVLDAYWQDSGAFVFLTGDLNTNYIQGSFKGAKEGFLRPLLTVVRFN